MPSQTTEFESLLEAVPDAMVGVDKSGVIRFVNHQAESLFGYVRDDLVGMPVEKLVAESLRMVHKVHRQSYNAAPRTRSMGSNLKLSGLRRDGTEFPVDISLSARDDADGELVIAAVRDMTHYHKEESDRRLDRLSAAVEFSGEAITSATLDGLITSWNPAAEKLFGYSREEMLGKPLQPMTPSDRPDEMLTVMERIRAGEVVQNFETVRVRKDGTKFPVSLNVAPIHDADSAGTIIGVSVIARDLTEQREALKSAKLMETIVQDSNEAIISSTMDGTVTSWNPAAEKLYGYPSEERIGKSAQDVVPEDRESEIRTILAKVRAGQPVEHLQTTRVRKDGTEFPVSLTVSPIREVDGTIVGASVVSRDISEQLQGLEPTRRLAAIVEQSRDAILSKSLDGTVTSWNPAAEGMFGYSSEEIIGKPGRLLGPESKADEIQDILAALGSSQDALRIETTRLRKDGTEFPVSLTASPIRDAGGTIVGVSAVLRDLTEQQRTFESARTMIETSLDSFVVISPEGKVTDANEATVRVTGVPRDKLIGTSFSDYFTDPGKAEEIYQRVLAEGSARDYPLTLRHRDGKDTFTEVLYNASVFRDPAGNVLGVFAAARDVSKQIEAQKEIADRRARELERLAELERFQRLTVGRELKMIELKKELEYLKKYGPRSGGKPGDQH